jgi:hypothetical protein
VFESLVHTTGKKPQLNRTELRSGSFSVAVALNFTEGQLQFYRFDLNLKTDENQL